MVQIYEERRHEDMTAALEAVLYPSAACLVGPQLGDDQPLNDMKKTVAALLMAGAEIVRVFISLERGYTEAKIPYKNTKIL